MFLKSFEVENFANFVCGSPMKCYVHNSCSKVWLEALPQTFYYFQKLGFEHAKFV
jgi:hypothetical protein